MVFWTWLVRLDILVTSPDPVLGEHAVGAVVVVDDSSNLERAVGVDKLDNVAVNRRAQQFQAHFRAKKR